MTARKNTVLRTAFADVYRIPGAKQGEFVEIVQSGTEVPASEAAEIVRVAALAGVTLYEVPVEDAPATKTEGGSS